MASSPTTTSKKIAEVKKPAIGSFRLGEDHMSEAGESESDQSAASERSKSPPKADGATKMTRSRKKRERRKVGALRDHLDTLLGAAFSTPNEDASSNGIASGIDTSKSVTAQLADDQVMDVESIDTGKTMNKRTRQNMAKMLARKQNGDKHKEFEEAKDQTQAAAAARRGMTLDEYRKQRKHGGKDMNKASERKLKKQKQRARKAAEEENKMDLG